MELYNLAQIIVYACKQQKVSLNDLPAFAADYCKSRELAYSVELLLTIQEIME